MIILFGFMSKELDKELGWSQNETQLQRQVRTIIFIEIIKEWLEQP
jgi:hypothetical protein